MRRGIIPKLLDKRVPVDCGLHDPALDAAASPMDDADVAESGLLSGVEVFRYDGRHVARREGVKVELGLDWNLERIAWNVRGSVRHGRRWARRPLCGIRP